MSRIGLIRETVLKHGGAHLSVPQCDYYVDGPNSICKNGASQDGIVRYKVNRRSDGLTDQGRQQVVDELNKHPDVYRAYISRKLNYRTYGGSQGQHIIVLFAGKTEQAKRATRTLREGSWYRRGV